MVIIAETRYGLPMGASWMVGAQELSDRFIGEVQVINPEVENLYILWSAFKHDHDPRLGAMFAGTAGRYYANRGITFDSVVLVPDSGTWLKPYFRAVNYQARFLNAHKLGEPTDGDAVWASLTYTERDAMGNRMPVQICVDQIGQVGDSGHTMLVVEDFLATGGSMKLHLEGIQAMGVTQVYVCAAVSIEAQEGRQTLLAHPLVKDVFCPIRVGKNGVMGSGFGKVEVVRWWNEG